MSQQSSQKIKKMPHFDHFPRPGEIGPYVYESWFNKTVPAFHVAKCVIQLNHGYSFLNWRVRTKWVETEWNYRDRCPVSWHLKQVRVLLIFFVPLILNFSHHSEKKLFSRQNIVFWWTHSFAATLILGSKSSLLGFDQDRKDNNEWYLHPKYERFLRLCGKNPKCQQQRWRN